MKKVCAAIMAAIRGHHDGRWYVRILDQGELADRWTIARSGTKEYDEITRAPRWARPMWRETYEVGDD